MKEGRTAWGKKLWDSESVQVSHGAKRWLMLALFV